jgi:predicted nucleotidyltransferase
MGDIEIIKVEEINEKLLNEIVKRILNVINPIRILLFGSWAYGQPEKSSDLDLLIVVEDGVSSRRKIASEIYGALTGFLISKDIIVATLRDIEDWKNVPQAFLTTIVRKGKVIYERKN